MLTSIQKELLKTLINLYVESNGKAVKGEDIADVVERSPGTIRNQMLNLRNLGLVNGVPGPRGGYKPTLEAYHKMNVSISDDDAIVPVYKGNKCVQNASVARIEFTSVPNPGECEAAIRIIGDIKSLNFGENIEIGPTPVNQLSLSGKIVGRNDMDNVLLLDATTIRSIPKKKVKEVGSVNLITLNDNDSIKDISKVLSSNSIEGAPVLDENKNVVGMITLNDIVKAIANYTEDLKVSHIMSRKLIKVDEDTMISEAIDKMHEHNVGRVIFFDKNNNLKGIITRTDILNTITSFIK
ncbi:CBS domain-containing protein [Methanobrevibacter curvatus]|nr:CBS domain-containing protein [Methanobrevibacter curvatus]